MQAKGTESDQLRRLWANVDVELARQQEVKSKHAEAVEILLGSPTSCERMADSRAPIARQCYQAALNELPSSDTDQPERLAVLKLFECVESWSGELATHPSPRRFAHCISDSGAHTLCLLLEQKRTCPW